MSEVTQQEDREALVGELRERERQLRETQQLAHIGSWEWDIPANVVSWSEELYRVYGLRPGELVPTFEGYLERVHPDDRERVRDVILDAFRRRTGFEFEQRIVLPDGAVRLQYARGHTEVDDEGNPVRMVGIGQDITERAESEERARELLRVQVARAEAESARRRVADIMDSIPQQVWTAGPDGQLNHVNRQVTEYFGKPGQEVLGQGWRGVVHPEDLPTAGERWARSLESGTPYEVEFRLRRADGAYRWHLGRATPQRDAAGRIVGWFGTNTDLHDQKEAEAARDRALQEAARERARLQEVFMNAPAVICLVEGSERIVRMANPAYLELTGQSEAVAQAFRIAASGPESSRFMGLLEEVFRSGRAYVGREERALLQPRGAAEPREAFFNFVYQPLTDASGEVGSVLIHAVEVTDLVRSRRQVEEKADQLTRLTAELRRSNEELDQFAYVASHDLKAPLRGISNLSQWIEEDLADRLGGETREHMSLLRNRVARMEALIDGLLDYSRVGRTRNPPENVSLAALVAEAVDLLGPPARFRIEVEADLPELVAERLPLQQVVQNLVANALKHADGEAPRVRIAGRLEEDWCHLEVVDNGPGIDPAYQDKIWGIFQTLKRRDEVEGTGIGLALVKKIVETRGGRVWVESQPGAGAAFHVLWPARPGLAWRGPNGGATPAAAEA